MYQYQVGFLQAVTRAFKNYCNFKGRASRSEFWWFYLFTYIVGMLFCGPYVMETFSNALNGIETVEFSTWTGVAYLWSLFILLPQLGLLFRRLHDSGRSGWNWLWLFLPVIGTIILLVYLCTASQPFTNKYGEVPNLENPPVPNQEQNF